MIVSRGRAIEMLEDLQAEGLDYLDVSQIVVYNEMSDAELYAALSEQGVRVYAIQEHRFASQ